jgi:hypothetical protein
MSWTTTPLVAGIPAMNSYTWTITGLTAASVYLYRSYFIVDGLAYFGNTLTGTTGAPPISIPNVTTGIACNTILSNFTIANNVVTNNGDLLIQEYGILYTQVSCNGTDSTLLYTCVGSEIFKTSICADIPINQTYNNNTVGLSSNTTWYRAFAKNAIGIGYGAINCETTNIIISPTSINNFSFGGGNQNITVCGQTWDTYTVTSNVSWITPSAPVAPSPTGTINVLTIGFNSNSNASRTGIVCYTPLIGTTQIVTIEQEPFV